MLLVIITSLHHQRKLSTRSVTWLDLKHPAQPRADPEIFIRGGGVSTPTIKALTMVFCVLSSLYLTEGHTDPLERQVDPITGFNCFLRGSVPVFKETWVKAENEAWFYSKVNVSSCAITSA